MQLRSFTDAMLACHIVDDSAKGLVERICEGNLVVPVCALVLPLLVLDQFTKL